MASRSSALAYSSRHMRSVCALFFLLPSVCRQHAPRAATRDPPHSAHAVLSPPRAALPAGAHRGSATAFPALHARRLRLRRTTTTARSAFEAQRQNAGRTKRSPSADGSTLPLPCYRSSLRDSVDISRELMRFRAGGGLHLGADGIPTNAFGQKNPRASVAEGARDGHGPKILREDREQRGAGAAAKRSVEAKTTAVATSPPSSTSRLLRNMSYGFWIHLARNLGISTTASSLGKTTT